MSTSIKLHRRHKDSLLREHNGEMRPASPPSSDEERTLPVPPLTLTTKEPVSASTSIDDIVSRIGFGRFQKKLLVLCGLGWLSDNMWMQAVATLMPRVQQHFSVPDAYIGIMSSSMFIGMAIGAFFWGMFSDFYGRKLAFNLTFILAAVFGAAACVSPHYWFICAALAFVGFGVGGNTPVDSALFIEFVPKEKQYLLTILSAFCSVGAVFTASLAWAILPFHSCALPNKHHPVACDPSKNNGWRYVLAALALLNTVMFCARFFLIKMEESPKYLLSHGKTDDAKRVLENIVQENARASGQSVAEQEEILKMIRLRIDAIADAAGRFSPALDAAAERGTKLSDEADDTLARPSVIRKIRSALHGGRLRVLFSRPWLRTTLLVWLMWILFSVAYNMFATFLPIFLQSRGVEGEGAGNSIAEIYQGYFIYSLFSIPGPFIGGYLAETRLGRRWTMVLATLLTGASTFFFTLVHSQTGMIAASAFINLFSITLYPVMYTYTPEVFDSTVRGSACGIASALGRFASIGAPALTGVLLGVSVMLPLWLSAGLFVVCAGCMALLPIETRGRAAQ